MTGEPASFRPKPRLPRGFEDRLPAQLALETHIVAKATATYHTWGFEPLETPAFEYADTLGKFLPDQDRPNEGVFALQDDDGQWMSLRYDLTAPLARFVAEHRQSLPRPYRRYAAGPVWRNEKPGPGRFRQFWQCDADSVGAPGPAADAEVIAMMAEALEAIGLAPGDYVIKLSDRRLLDGLLDTLGLAHDEAGRRARIAVLRSIDKIDRLGADGVRLLLTTGRKDDSGDFTPGACLEPAMADRVLAFVAGGAGIDDLERLAAGSAAGTAGASSLRQIAEILARLGLDASSWRLDTSVVRGLEYYTGPVFEAETVLNDVQGRRISFGSVASGGRYDGLVARFGGEAAPATGCSIGVSRLAAVLQAAGRAPGADAGPVVVLALQGEHMPDYFAMAQSLRGAGFRAEVYVGGAGMKAQMKYADKRGAAVAVIVGEDERAKGVVTVKNLRLGQYYAALAGDARDAWKNVQGLIQVEAPRDALVETVKAAMSARAP
jgi:histidyl-tRNA synthetase